MNEMSSYNTNWLERLRADVSSTKEWETVNSMLANLLRAKLEKYLGLGVAYSDLDDRQQLLIMSEVEEDFKNEYRNMENWRNESSGGGGEREIRPELVALREVTQCKSGVRGRGESFLDRALAFSPFTYWKSFREEVSKPQFLLTLSYTFLERETRKGGHNLCVFLLYIALHSFHAILVSRF